MMEDALTLLAAVRNRFSQREVAKALDVDARTVRRWEARQTDPPQFLGDAIRQRLMLAERRMPEVLHAFRFIDLFAGIGGIRRAFEAHGGQCVFTSEWDKFAKQTYLANYPDSTHTIHGDIREIAAGDIPDHDLLLAGFPCQPFSIAGVSKKNALGRAHGFADKTQGTLFFDVARIIDEKKPKAFLLENVKNIRTHDKGNTLRVIERVLREDLKYKVSINVIDGARFVPQHRERLLIVGFREATDFSWDDLQLPATGPKLGSILHPEDGSEAAEGDYTLGPKAKVNRKYTLTEHLWGYLQAYAAKHQAKGNGFGFGLVDAKSVTRTLSQRYHKDGSEILVSNGRRKRPPRRLTPRECARLMGYPGSFKIPVSDTQAYRQFGNSVVVPMITEVARIMVPRVLELIQQERDGVRQEPLLVSETPRI